MIQNYLQSAIQQFQYYKQLGSQTFEQLNDAEMCFIPNEVNNSIAIIVQHMSGNMISRFTDFLTRDGEKAWRNRDEEFEQHLNAKAQVIEIWEKGWQCLFNTLATLNESDFEKTVYIRSQAHSVIEAINRQIAHYAYHVGQIVFIGKLIKNLDWKNLSIAKGASIAFNEKMVNNK